ncbi:serine/threonine-protein kinase HT isoform X3 [Spatholobus suberectus]|nr:serine/threonine-protein kinase HT isoform X3 [Spatholobus suberectus]
MDLVEGVGESSSPPRTFSGYSNYDVRSDVYNRLVETGHDQAVSNPEFREQLEAHFNRLPPSYGLDVNIDRAEDVLLHQTLLALARDPDKRPVYHIRFLENISTRTDGEDQQILSTHYSPGSSSHATNGGAVPSGKRYAIQ